MSFWQSQRVPEPEEMDAPEEVESYSAAAAEEHLAVIDSTFVEHLIRLLPPAARDQPILALDVGSGPAQIPIIVLQRLPAARFVALDRFPNMLASARQNAARAGVSDSLHLIRCDGHLLPFPASVFAVVTCNSVLHHASDPLALLREIFRVASPEGAVLVRDLRRPSRPLLRWHLWRHGRRYSGAMRRLFNASVRASYTEEEVGEMLSKVDAPGARVFRYGGAHLGIERPAGLNSSHAQAPLG